MIFKYQRILFICISLILLTSSCEDRKKNSFGKITLSFNYGELLEEDLNSSETVSTSDKENIKIIDKKFKKQKDFSKENELLNTNILNKDIIKDDTINDNENVDRSNEMMFDYRYASISINSGDPQIIDLTTTTSFSQSVPIGTTTVYVELLNSTNLAIYNAVKNITVLEDQSTPVNFISDDWAMINQEINITNNFEDSYTLGENIEISWTNTHTRRGVRLQLIQETSQNIIETIISDYKADSFDFDTSDKDAATNLGFKVTSMIGSGSDYFCCFDLVTDNQAPIANNVSETTNEDESVQIALDGGDSDGDSLSYIIVSNPSNGTLGSIDGNNVQYFPNQHFNGTDSFTYKVNDGTVDSNIAQVTIGINAINDAPTTNDVSTTIDENRIARIADLTLDGDDVDGDNLTYILTSDPSNGSASINGNILTYNANQDWNGEETFSYKANDGHLDSNVSTITITVNPVNDNPVVSNPANSKALNGEHDYINLGPVINFNNNNPNSTPPGLGSWSLIFNARIDHLDDNGRAAILSSGVDATNQGVFFGIYTINGIPRLSLDFYQVDNLASDDVSSIIGDGVFHSFAVTYSGSSAKLFLDGVKVAENSFAGNYGNNDQDLWLGLSPWNNFNDLNGYLNYGAIWTGEHSEDDILDMHNGTENPGDHPTNLQGWWDFNSNSSFEDLSTNNFTASYATNGTQGEDVNLSLNEDSSIDIDLQSYVYDVDNDALTYTIVNQPENGTLTFISDSEIRYEPAANYNGLDEFSWKVNDGTVDSNTSTINIEVISVNDSPTTDGGKTYSTPYDTALDIVLSGEDVDGDNLTFSVTETSTSGSATIEISNNIATITPTTTNSVNTKISFKYQVSDGNL
ncbi:MAG: Ig-like domain-containing protein, partial [Candidatus Neomarinimicrobiota bacterium]